MKTRSHSLRYAETICPVLGQGHADGAPLVTPIVQSTTYARDGVGSTATHQYSRVSNPTVDVLEQGLGELEHAPPAVCFSTGLAAETALFLALLRSGDHVVCGRGVYGGTTRLLEHLLPDLGVRTTFVDATRIEGIRAAIRDETRVVFVETPSNPTLDLTDVRAAADVTHDASAVLVVDNTFLTPVLQTPLDLGADVSVYSTTKFIDGHSVAPGGALVSRDDALLDRFRFIRKCTGAIQTPFHAWLTIQGIKTLPLRLQRQSETAATIARFLDADARVATVSYPGLDRHPHRDLARSQHRDGDGAVIAFEVRGGLDAGRRVVERLRRCRLAEHVGSVETLITHPATMTHADVDPAARRAAGLPDGLLRLSVGLEPASVLIEDLDQALDACAPSISTTTSTSETEVTPCPQSA